MGLLCHHGNMAHKQSLQSKLKQPFTKFQYDCQLDWSHSNNSEDIKQNFCTNKQFSVVTSHLSKLVVNCCNEKLWKRGQEISKIIYYLLTVFLIIKVKEGLNLHFLFISCKLSVYGMIYNPMKSSGIGLFFVNFPPWKWK